MAILAWTVARIAGSKSAKISDFMPEFKVKQKKQTAQEQMNVWKSFVAAHNAKVKQDG